MSKISFVYFDVGGVVIKDYSSSTKWKDMQRDLGITEDKTSKFEEIWEKETPRVCIDYDVDNLVPVLRQELNLNIPDNYSMLQDFVNRFEKNESIWPVLDLIKSQVPIGLITNQYPRMLDLILDKGLFPQLNWHVIVDSSIEGVKKSNPAIYQIATDRAGVPKEEILFIENAKKHIDGASNFGFQTFYYDSSDYEKSSQELADFFNQNI